MKPSFIPDRDQRVLRDLTRTRTSLIDERSAAVKRLQKVLEDAFHSVDELDAISGIGPAKLDQLRDLVVP